ncbi:acetyl-CoA carboxylase biotin carboxylase subunit family protein [Kitasatospora arboriphila]
MKPLYGGGSRDTHLVRDEETLARLAERHPAGMMVEEYLQGRPSLPYGDYVSVESLCAPDRITHVSVSGKFPMAPPFREQGQFWPSALPPQDVAAVADLTTRALRALGVDFGVTHTEVKLTARGPRIIEVNGLARRARQRDQPPGGGSRPDPAGLACGPRARTTGPNRSRWTGSTSSTGVPGPPSGAG